MTYMQQWNFKNSYAILKSPQVLTHFTYNIQDFFTGPSTGAIANEATLKNMVTWIHLKLITQPQQNKAQHKCVYFME